MKKLLIIGWESADWNLTLPLVDAGKLPNLQGLIERGVVGRMTGVQPVAKAAGWTSLSTGKYPCRHGIVSDLESIPGEFGIRPSTQHGRQSRTLWDILEQHGRRCQLIGWPASHPASPLQGSCVSDWFARLYGAEDGTWPMVEGTVHPAELIAELTELRLHPRELGPEDLRPFFSESDFIDLGNPLVAELRLAMAHAASIQAAATELLSTQPWDVAAVHFDALGHISERFLNFHPPQLDFIDSEDYQRYHRVLETAYVLHDMMLGALLEQIDEQTTVAVVSEHGFHLDNRRRPPEVDKPNAPPASYQLGMLVLSGPGIQKDTLIYGSSVLDIAPTLLHQLDIAVAKDMDGRVLQQMFTSPKEPQWVDTWEPKIKVPDWSLPDSEAPNSGNPELDAALRDLEFARLYAAAESFVQSQQEGHALQILSELWRCDPAETRYPQRMINCYLALRRPDLARDTLERMLTYKKRHAPAARRAWQVLEARDPVSLSASERTEKARLWKRSRTNLAAMGLMQVSILRAEGRTEEALALALATDPTKVLEPTALISLRGELLLALARLEEAEAQFEQYRELLPTSPEPYLGLSRVRYEQQKFQEAADLAAKAIGLRYFHSDSHHLYAAAIYQAGHPDRAADALKVAVEQNPCAVGAFDRLSLLYHGPLDDRSQASYFRIKTHEAQIEEQRRFAERSQGLEPRAATASAGE